MKIEWSTFAVPYSHFRHYILLMIFALWFLPGIMGIRFTMYGYILNYLWADFMFYIWYKHKMITQEYWKEQKRKQDWKNNSWRDDDDESNRME